MNDSRIPVSAWQAGAAVPAGAVLLREGEAFSLRHAFGCACCGARSPVVVAFDRLFLAQVKGERRIDAVMIAGTPAAVAAARAAVGDDRLLRARFRWQEP